MGSYNHSGTEKYGNYFGNNNWQSVDWSAVERKSTLKTDLPPATHTDTSVETGTEVTTQSEVSPKSKNRAALIKTAADLGLFVVIDPDTDVMKFSTQQVEPEHAISSLHSEGVEVSHG